MPTAAISRSQSSSTLINHLLRSPTAGNRIRLPQTGLTHYARSEALVKGICEKIFCERTAPDGQPYRTTVITLLRPKDLSVLHDKLDVLEDLDVVQRIATHRDDVSKTARSHQADLAFHIEHYRRAGRGTLNRIHRLHAEFHHARKFLRYRLGPGDSSHVGAEHDLYSHPERFLE